MSFIKVMFYWINLYSIKKKNCCLNLRYLNNHSSLLYISVTEFFTKVSWELPTSFKNHRKLYTGYHSESFLPKYFLYYTFKTFSFCLGNISILSVSTFWKSSINRCADRNICWKTKSVAFSSHRYITSRSRKPKSRLNLFNIFMQRPHHRLVFFNKFVSGIITMEILQ